MKQEIVTNLQSIVERNYDEVAKQYSETRKKKLWSGLEDLLDKVETGAKVLDVGCGSGKLLINLQEKGVRYLGVDTCTKLLSHAEEDYPGYEFKEGDILRLGQLPELNFDYVFAVAVLQHIPSEELRVDALKQLKNKVSDKGKIVISNWNMWSNKWTRPNFKNLFIKFSLLKLIGKNKMDLGDITFDWKNSKGEIVAQRYYHMFTLRELRRISKKAGLSIKKIFKDDYNYYLILRK
jgi:ubiquinone/menaquinone biosynthesis C-methylase UbiE